MNYREKMKEYLKEPDEHSYQWGKWCALNREQRDLIKRLLREMDSADVVIKNQFEENEKLKELCNKYEEEHNTTFEEWKKTKVKLSKEQRKKILKSLEEGVMEIEYFGELYDWKNAEELYKVCIKQQKEIERLTKQNKTLNEMYELTKKEYIRLNNIIKELDKQNGELGAELSIIKDRVSKAIFFIQNQELHKSKDTTGAITMKERELIDLLLGSEKEC